MAFIHELPVPDFFDPASVERVARVPYQERWQQARAWAAAHAQACAAIEQIGAGAVFETLARAHSGCSSAASGGALGQFLRGDLAPPIEEALTSLTPGQLAPAPVRTRHGWHLVRLDRHAPARVLPFEAVAERIRAALHARSAIAASARYVEALAASAEIEGLALGRGAGS